MLVCIAVGATERYDIMSQRARRSFDWQEWSSAVAMYQLMLAERPDSLSSYGRAIVACQMLGDTALAVDLVERAMAQGIGLAEVLAEVQHTDFSIGQGDRYGSFLLTLQKGIPWMSRGLDNELLRYYTYRHDGPMMVHYARIMLDGLPDSRTYLSALAQGQLLSGDTAGAVTTWERIIELYPDHYDTLINLGTYYNAHGNPDRGLELLAKARNLKSTPALEQKTRVF